MAKNTNVQTDTATDETTEEMFPETKETKVTNPTIDLTVLTPAERKVLAKLYGGNIPTTGTLRMSTPKNRNPKPCFCGCGETTKSLFTAGHDARMKSVANSVIKGETPKFPNHTGLTKASAKALLAERGW